MSKGKQLREELIGACSCYAIGDHKVPQSGWMVGFEITHEPNTAHLRKKP